MSPITLRLSIIAASLLVLASGANAQAVTPESHPPTSGTVSVQQLMAQPEHGFKKLSERGIDLHLLFVNDWSKTWDPDGSATGFGQYSLDLSLALDGDKSVGWKGSSGLIRLKQHIREFGSGYDVPIQVFSNIDAASRTTLYEVWLQQSLRSDKFRFKVGKIDANTEFAVVESGGDFLNSSMGYSPTILALPTYPEPKLGGGIFLRPVKHYSVNLGVFQTTMGTMSLIEPGRRWAVGARELPGHVSLGYWRVDGDLDAFDGRQSRSTQGFYSVLEQSVWRASSGESGTEQNVTSFLQFGYSDEDISSLSHHIGGGAVMQSPWRRRGQDAAGLAATWVRFSQQPGAGFEQDGEVAVEGYYKLALNPHISLVADFQFLHHPGGLSDDQDCPVITPRLVISF